MIRVPLTPSQFAAKVAELEQKEGLDVMADSGKLTKDGVTATYSYDGTAITAEVIDHPLREPKFLCEATLKSWLTASPAPEPNHQVQ